MNDLDSRCLDAFPEWLRLLGVDARAMAVILADEGVPESVRRNAAVALNYLFKSLDLIPDGIEDLGYIDDAFVFRVVAAGARESGGGAVAEEAKAVLERLASEVALVREFLGDDYGRLAVYIRGLEGINVRGRSVDDVLKDPDILRQFVAEARTWSDCYVTPAFARDEKNLVKLRSFMHAKLPA